jgi:hypothetical protein
MKKNTFSRFNFARLFLLVCLLFIWNGAMPMDAQKIDRSTGKTPVENTQLSDDNINFGLGMHWNQSMNRGSEYLAKLDTIKNYSPRDGQTVLSLMYVFEFDENNNNTKRATYAIRTNIGFTRINEMKTHFDQNNFRISDTTYVLDGQGIWRPATLRDYEYNQDGMNTVIIAKSYDANSGLYNYSSKTVNEYDGDLRVQQSFYFYDDLIEEYYLWQYLTWEFDDNLLTSRHTYLFNEEDNSFDITFRNSFEYNDDRLVTVSESYNRFNPENQLRPVNRLEFFYNNDGLLVLENRFLPILPQTNGVEWRISQQEETSYNDFGRPEYILLFEWIEEEEEWETIQRTENIYDAYENILNTLTYLPNYAIPGQWLLDQDLEYEYNYDFDSGTYLSDPQLVDASSHMILSTTTHIVNPTRPGFRNEYIYSDLSVNTIDLLEKNDIHIFPNPVRDILSIQFDPRTNLDQVIKVIDVKGRIIYQNHFSGSLDISTDMWSAGVYTVVLQEPKGNTILSRQFIKQ